MKEKIWTGVCYTVGGLLAYGVVYGAYWLATLLFKYFVIRTIAG